MDRRVFDENVFCRLSTYRPRPDRDSAEDFLTEAYAVVLLSDRPAASRVLSQLFFDKPEQGIDSAFKLRTQERFDEGRPDMVIRDEKWIIYQENKLKAPFRDGQIKCYEDELDKELKGPTGAGKKGLVVSCAIESSPPGCSQKKHIRWRDVFSAVEANLPPENSSSRHLWDDFLEFLEVNGMSPVVPIKRNVIEAIAIVDRLSNQLRDILDHVAKDLLEEYPECIRLVPPKSSSSRPEAYSRFRMGNLELQPWLEARQSTIFVEVIFFKPGPDANKECHDAFKAVDALLRNRSGEHATSSIAVDDIPPPNAFFESARIEDQAKVVSDWINGVALAPLVNASLIKKK